MWIAGWANWSRGDEDDAIQSVNDSYVGTRSDFKTWTSVPGCFESYFKKFGCLIQDGEKGYISFGWCGKKVSASTLADFLEVPDGYDKSRDGDAKKIPIMYYMDKDCKYTEISRDQRVCGYGGVSWSPLSLIFDDTTNINEGMTVASFSVDPRHPKALSLWKASEKAPLLVYDPQRTGIVTSARQLFGNYTFGGRNNIPTVDDTAPLGDPWTHGYEALGSLDANQDGKISGGELEPLSLWFDTDRDGVSDAGEVVPLAARSVYELYYRDPESSPSSKDSHLARGFARLVDGKEFIGASVDWYAETFADYHEASEALRAKILGKSTAEGDETREADSSERVTLSISSHATGTNAFEFKPHEASDHSTDLSGFWMWSTFGSEGKKHPGFFALEQQGERIVGYTVVEAILEGNAASPRSAVRVIPIEGDVRINSQGGKEFAFTLFDVNREVTVRSTATISSTGTTLEGTTIQRVSSTKDGAPHSAETSYSWRAEKFLSRPRE